jgi:tetratricopeptide (TPR) repeat protein
MLIVLVSVLASPARADQPAASRPGAPGAQGKIVLIQGHVDRAVANQPAWDPARVFQELFAGDRVRTLVASRTAILFIDETQVKLNAGAILSVQQIRQGQGGPTTLDLLEGEGWFRTKNPASGLTIKTPTASAAVRGTEINLQIRGPATVLTVTEGSAEFSNDAGSLRVNAGEEATATPGQPPTKRILLNPEDAVQWVLYYPTRVAWHDLPGDAQAAPARAGFDRLRAGDATGALAALQPTIASDPWSRIGAAMAYEQLGDPVQARALLEAGPPLTGEAELERRAQLGVAALAIGDARAARSAIDDALAIDRTALSPLVLLSALELTQNHRDAAAAAARAAVAGHPASVAAHVAAAEAAQAGFDLDEARHELDAALAIDVTDVRALIDRARIRFGVGDTPGARQDADRAAAAAGNDPQARSLLGFIKIADGQLDGARADFDAAVAADAAFGEPHLGLGLIHFREQQLSDGLLEMLTATLLEPKVSLYQSYLGKSYYQLQRFPEGLAALASAKRLDPRDSTPWLYTSLFLRDQNRQVSALDELRHAIALNDNRAVYRSRLLLDRDLATANVSLAQLYDQLGFAAWGASEALNSLDADLTNASAHLFLANTYGLLPDRTQALSSELLQYFLYAPVNLNSFNNFSEYTALLEQPQKQALLTAGAGDRHEQTATVTTRSGNQRFAHTAFLTYDRLDGPRIDRADQRAQGFAQAKLALGPSSDLFFSLTGVKSGKGQSNDVTRTIGTFPDVVVVRDITEAPDPTFTHNADLVDGTIGFRHTWRPGSALTAAGELEYTALSDQNLDATVSACQNFDLTPFLSHSSSRLTYPTHAFNVQAQQTTRAGRHQVLVGGDVFRRRKAVGCQETIIFDPTGEIVGQLDKQTRGTEKGGSAYVRDEIELSRRTHATVGARYQDLTYGDELELFPDFHSSRWNPFAGLSVRLSPGVTVHAAGFRNTNANFIGSRISPPTVAGFVLDRNELPTAQRDEGAVAVQSAWHRSFLEGRVFTRRVVAPAFLRVSEGLEAFAGDIARSTPDASFHASGFSAFFNQIVAPRVSVFADEQVVRFRPLAFDRTDNQVSVGLNFIHERGFFARATTRYLTQRFSRTQVTGLPRPSFSLTDGEFKYEFARKRGLAVLSITNLFNQGFRTVIENLAVEQPLPYRRIIATLRWRI